MVVAVPGVAMIVVMAIVAGMTSAAESEAQDHYPFTGHVVPPAKE